MSFGKTIVNEETYRGHKVELHKIEKKNEETAYEVRSNLLDEPLPAETKEGTQRWMRYAKGYIDGWKDAGGN